MYLPEQLDVTQFELGRNRYKWGNVLHFKEEFNADGTCIVTRKKDKGDLTDREFIKILGRKTSVDPSLIYTFVRRYRKRLIDLGIQGNRLKDLIVGWDPYKGNLCYTFQGPLDGYAPEQPHSGVLRFGQHTDAACLCFAATVFSLLKQPMRSVMKNDTQHFEFSLYVYSEKCVSTDDFFDHVLDYADLYCNFRNWGDSLIERYEGAKFCYQYPKECNHSACLAWWNHLYFPVVFTNDSIDTEESDDEITVEEHFVDMLTAEERAERDVRRRARLKDNPVVYEGDSAKDDLEHKIIVDHTLEDDFEGSEFKINKARKYLKKLTCLPVLVMYEGAEGEPLKGKNVLSLHVNMDSKSNGFPNDYERHNCIMGGYVGFLKSINHGGMTEFRAACKEASKKAYQDLGTLKKDATRQQHYQAKLLCSIYVAQHYAIKNTLFYVAVQDTLVYLKKHIAHLATAEDFAQFLRCTSTDDSVIFHCDDTGIYLHYKQYWLAFQKYCENHGIVLSVSAAQFRRTVLKNYIRPQYQASGGKYLRYDYRKKVDGREAVVLNVDPKILDLLHS